MNASIDAGTPGWTQAMLRNLRAGLAIATFRSPHGVVATLGQLASLAVLDLVANVIAQAAMAGFAGQVAWGGLATGLFPAMLFVVAAAIVCGLAGRGSAALALAVGMVAATLWLGAAVSLIGHVVEGVDWRGAWRWMPWVVAYGGLAWVAAAFAVAAARMLPLSWAGRLAAILVGCAVIAYPLLMTAQDRALWVRAPDPDAGARQAAYAAAAGEALLYAQPPLLSATLDALLPRRPGRPNLYLLGMAGYAEQDVFMQEVLAVDALFAERFGTRGRSLKLVNNRATLRDIPLATRTSLTDALRRVGSVMDRDEDILFLFLTSHGSADGRLSLEFYPLSLADLTPPELRGMLDSAGIRYRVIVISACYSGRFVEALRNDDTLVITASAADRNSFGCSNEADFTYFGKAYFDEALRTSDSFMDAFDAALPVIAGREKRQEYTPSLPQRVAGPNILPRLAAWRDAMLAERPPAGQNAAPR